MKIKFKKMIIIFVMGLCCALFMVGMTSCKKDQPSDSGVTEPDNPDNPDTPDNPDNPDQPDNPDTPDNPDNPDQPDNPDEPNQPDDPEIVYYTVTFDAAGGKMSGSTTASVEKGKTISVPAEPIKIGEEFIAWTTTSGAEFDFSTPINEDITLKASYDVDPMKYTIKFNSNGGSAVEDISKISRNETPNAPEAPTKTGNDFVGWYLDGKLYDFTTPVTKNITLVARWTAAKITVTFDTAGGSALPNQVIEYNTKAVNPGEPTKTDARFVGWLYQGQPFDFDTLITQNITLTADWENTYTLTFKNPTASYSWQQIITYKVKENTTVGDDLIQNEDIATPDAGFSHNGYFKWVGWYIEGTDTPFDFTVPVTSSMNIVARWDEYYYVAFSNSNVEEIVIHKGDTVAEYYEALGVAIPTPSDDYGHPFDNWYYSGDLFDVEMPIVENIVVAARYKFYLDFNSVGGSPVDRQVIGYGKYGVAPENPVKDHYHFLGWYNSGEPFVFEANAIVGDITLTARWVYVFNGKGTETEPYLLSTKDDVLNLSELMNKDGQDPVTGTVYRSAYFKLANDINMAGAKHTPMSHFIGTFDGAGYGISNFTITTMNTANVGFFAELENPAEVKNLKLNGTIEGQKATNSNIGMLAGLTDDASIKGIEVEGSITLNAERMERATLGGLIGKAIQTSIYATKIGVIIKGGNLVGGIVGYATEQTMISSCYVTEGTELQVYRTGSIGGLVGMLDVESMVVSSYTLATVRNSIYTEASDSKFETFGFGSGAYVNCHDTEEEKASLYWNEADWNADLTLNVIPDTHNQVQVTIYNDKNERVNEISCDYGSTVTLDSIEGAAGTVFIGYSVDGKYLYNEKSPVYGNLNLSPIYGTYQDMLGMWKSSEGKWLNLRVEQDTILASASIYTGEYETTGSNFREIPLIYTKSQYETMPYVSYNNYGECSITGDFYETVVLYFQQRSTIIGAANVDYRMYLQRIPSGDYDKAFMRLERLEDKAWVLVNDLLMPYAGDYSGYYLNDAQDKLFVKAPYLPNLGNYDQVVWYEGATQNSEFDYTPFLFIGVPGFDEAVLGFTTADRDYLGDYILVEDSHLLQIYDYQKFTATHIDYYESFEYMNARWYNDNDGWDYLCDNQPNTKPKDPYIVVEETEVYNHVISVDEETKQITFDGNTFPYSKSKNGEGVAVLSFEHDGKKHLFWADYVYESYFGISFYLHYECQNISTSGTVEVLAQEDWQKYELVNGITWVEDQPDEDEPDISFGNIEITPMQITMGNAAPVDYDFVYVVDNDGIPGMEITFFSYLRFAIDGTTYYIREHSSTGYVYLYYEDPNHAGHLLSRRFKNEADFSYYNNAYAGEWISKDQQNRLDVDIDAMTINGYEYTYQWYTPTEYDTKVMGTSARYYDRVAVFSDGTDTYQFRVTFVRDGYGYLFKYDSATDSYLLENEYFGCNILNQLVGSWNYYDGAKVDNIEVISDLADGYQVYYNGTLMDAKLTWNSYNGVPVLAFKLDDGEKVELLHLVYAGAYGYDLMDVLDYDSYDAVYDEGEGDMVYEYTNKYKYFKDTTISDVVETMSGTWTDGSMTVTIKSDEISVIEPGYEPITLSIAYIYDLPSIYMDQYVVIMIGVDGEGNSNYSFYYYNYYIYADHYVSEEESSSGVLVRRDDVMVFRGNFISVGLEETHNIFFDGVTLSVDEYEFDPSTVTYNYAQLTDGRIVPVFGFSDVVDMDVDNLKAVLRSCSMYYVDGVMAVDLTDTHVTLEVSGGSIGIASYDKVEKLLENETFYRSDIIQYNGLYTFNTDASTVATLALNDGYTYVNGQMVKSDILVLGNGSLQVTFEFDEVRYLAIIGIDAYGNMDYQIYKMSLV